ncbi:hypothetical protein ES703_31676 [subsurface metagenome]
MVKFSEILSLVIICWFIGFFAGLVAALFSEEEEQLVTVIGIISLFIVVVITSIWFLLRGRV